METVTDSSQESNVRALKLTVGVYILVLAMKLAVYFATGVMAIFAEALHTLSDIFVSSFLLVASIWSRREADEVHMFGYGRAQNVAALVAATLFISFTSFELYREAIPRLFEPGEDSYQNLSLAIGVIVLSMFIAAIPLINLFRQKSGSSSKGTAYRAVQRRTGTAGCAGRHTVHYTGRIHSRPHRLNRCCDHYRLQCCRTIQGEHELPAWALTRA